MLARSVTLFVLALSALAGCSADSVPEPVPEIERGGSFVAVTSIEGAIILLRTLRIVRIDGPESIYEAIVYEGQPSSYAEAKAWAKDRDWPVYDAHGIFSLQSVLSIDPEVVWFRTLTENERAALLH